MSLTLNIHKGIFSLLGSGLVLSSILTENLFDEIHMQNYLMHQQTIWAIPLLFIIGWIFIIVAIRTFDCSNLYNILYDKNSIIPIISIIIIVVSTIILQQIEHSGTFQDVEKRKKYLTLIFSFIVLGFIILSGTITYNSDKISKTIFAFGGSFLTILGLLIIHNYQMPNGYINGPGIALLGLGLGFISLSISIV